ELAEDVEGYLRASEISRYRVEDVRNHLKEGDEVEAVIIAVDRKNRGISLSIKAKDAKEQSEALKAVSANSNVNAGTTSLGDLLKAKLSGVQDEEA
ncbi:MAG: S1 RNA-binding domain-containing protein, partial [Neisseriaceae bacterium]|nr:S1 RNA-binding domain-containing protein [Neisseriaceae bacterium]